MRTLSQAEIDQVSGGVDSINVGGVSITGIEAGIALRNVMGATGVAFAAGYGTGTLIEFGVHGRCRVSRWEPISISGRTSGRRRD